MTVSSKISKLDMLNAYPKKEILAKVIADLMHRLNALYEGVTDEACPGAVQTYAGHDHSYVYGGQPIPRSCTQSADFGTNMILDTGHVGASQLKTPYASTLGMSYYGPGLTNRYTEVALYVKVEGAKIKVWMGPDTTGGEVIVEPTEGTESGQWIFLKNYVTVEDDFAPLIINWEYQEDKVSFLKVYACVEAETWESSLSPQGLFEITKDTGVVGKVLSYFGLGSVLDDDLVAALETLDAYTLKILMWSLNALYEVTTDSKPPGASTRPIEGHDHLRFGDGGQCGIPIPKGCIFSYGSGPSGGVTNYQNSVAGWLYSTCTVAGRWEYTDLNTSGAWRRTTGLPHAVTGIGTGTHFYAYVTPTITSSGTPPTTNPCLVAYVYLYGATIACELRMYNKTANVLSPVVAFDPATHPDGFVRIPFVPCVGGVWNEFTLQVMSDTVPATYKTEGVWIYEAYSQTTPSTQDCSVLTSVGSQVMGVAPKTTAKVLGG